MSAEYIEKNVNEIEKDSKYEFPLNMAMASAWILGNFKGINLKVIDTRTVSSLADYYVLASASNSTQARSMADQVMQQMKRKDLNVVSKEGLNETADWILIDLGDFIVHIFQETSRDVYDIDGLWDAPQVDIPNEFYYGEDESGSTDEDKGYF